MSATQTIRDIVGVLRERPPKNFPRQFLPRQVGFGDTLHNFFERIGVGAKVKSYFAKQKRDCGCERRRRFWNRVCPYKPKRGEVFLTIGMAHFQDWEGAWATIQSIWSEAVAAGVADLIEVLVVDQSADSPHGEKLKGYLQGWGLRSKYVTQPNVGTAMGKHAVFANATGEWVMLLDCHADLQPGSLGNVVKWIMRNRFNQSLFGGVMEFGGGYQWYRDRIGTATLADPKRRDVAMLAPQTVALIEDCAKRPTDAERLDCVLGTDRGYHSHVDRVWRGDSLGRWATDQRAADPKSPPFPVDNLAGWFLFCRRDSWVRLQPYHPLMKGFGGEEGVMTLAFEKAKWGSFVHPAARATHRFGRADPPKFSLNLHDRIKNYVLAFTQWDRPDELERMRTYFVVERESVLMSEVEFDTVAATALAEHHAFLETQKANRKPTMSLDEMFKRAATIPSDFNEHVPVLNELARQCRHVTELGKRLNVTTVALLHAQPATLISVIPGCASCQINELTPVKGNTDLRILPDDWLAATIEPTELLFIDTFGSAKQLRAELGRYAALVSRWIVLHDTVVWGENGEDGSPGLMFALREFLATHSEWSVVQDFKNNHGLTVIERDAKPKPQPNYSSLRRSLIFHCFPKLGTDWRGNCLATFRYRSVFNGRLLVSITSGPDCERSEEVVEWFRQFGPELEITVVPNDTALGINTTFRDQLRAIQHEDGIVFKSHTKGISHAGDPFGQWRVNMADGCLSNIDFVEQKFREGFRTFSVYKTFSDEGSHIMGQDVGPCKTDWPGWHFPGAFFWFDPKFIPESFFALPSHHYENEAFPCHLGPTETGYSLTPDNLNFQAAAIGEFFAKLNRPLRLEQPA